MKYRTIPLLALCLSALLAGFPILRVARTYSSGSSGDDISAMRIGVLRHQSQLAQMRDRLARFNRTGVKKDKRNWALSPKFFDHLSSAGRRGVLMANGLIPIPSKTSISRPRKAVVHAQQQPAAGQNIRVNDPLMDVDGHTQSETSIAVSGPNIIETFNDSGLFADFGGYAYSTDGGASFTQASVPLGSNGENLGDGVVSAGPNGEFYHSQIAVAPTSDSLGNFIIAVSKSTDNGVTFSDPVDASTTLTNSTDVQDKPWNTTDRSASSPFRGNVYVSWTDFSFSNGVSVVLARSTNGGASFQTPVAIVPADPGSDVQGSMPAVAPNGDLYVAYFDFTNAPVGSIMVAKSTDGGVTFSAPVAAATGLNPVFEVTGGDGVRANSFPSVVVDGSGNVHIVYDAAPEVNGPDRSDVFYVRSTDGGATFSTPVRLNDDATNATQLSPSIAAAANGALGVKWWDRRNDPANDNLDDVYMTISHDGGASFGKNFRITDRNWVFGPVEPGLATGYHGDYDDIAADGDNFYLSWSDERNFNPDSFFALIPVARDASTPDFNVSARSVYRSVAPGDSTEIPLSTRADNGFSGEVALSASPQIPGISYAFSSASVSPGTPVTLTVSPDASTHPGIYQIIVQAVGGGLTRSTAFQLTVFGRGRQAGDITNVSQSPGFSSLQGGLKIDQSGTVHVAYDDDTAVAAGGDQVLYKRSSDGGASYSAPVLVSTNPGISFDSTLCLDAGGNPCIVYQTISDPSAPQSVAFISRSTDGGTTFSTPVQFSDEKAADVTTVVVAIDGNGNIMAAYEDASGQLFVTRSPDGGQTFSKPQRLSGDNEQVTLIPGGLGFDSAGAAYLTYGSFQITDTSLTLGVRLVVAKDGMHFGQSVAVTDPNNLVASDPVLVLDPNGGLYISYSFDMEVIGGSFFALTVSVAVVKSCDGGATFGTPVVMPTGTSFAILSSMVVDPAGGVDVAWEGGGLLSSKEDIFVSRSADGGATFERPMMLSGGPGNSFGASIAARPDGNLLVSWTDDSFANSEVASSVLPMLQAGPSDFSLVLNQLQFSVVQGEKGSFDVLVGRTGGFSGTVTITPPDTSAVKVKLKPNAVSANCSGARFSFKVKASAPVGTSDIVFTGQDTTGRTRTATVQLVIRPN